jgi:HTH-type transcriptional regulator / antitoxin HigA
MRNIRAIRNEADHKWALKEIESYFDRNPAPGSEAADRFDVLAALIKEYEERTVAIPDADPIDVLEFAIESIGRSQAELAEIVGSRSRASEILNRKRQLTLQMIRDISAAWHIPVEALVGAYGLRRKHA